MICFEHIYFGYPGHAPVLNNISLKINESELVAILGPNGAGKSTFLKLVCGILLPDSGQIKIDGRVVGDYQRRQLARLIGYMGQEFHSVFDFEVSEIVRMGRFPYLSALGKASRSDQMAIDWAIDVTEIGPLSQRRLSQLSGGERQRVFLASTLAQEPGILLLDEPTRALDMKHQTQFFRILQTLHAEKNMTIVLVSHDLNLAARFCTRWLALKSGQVIADGGVEAVLQKKLLDELYNIDAEVFDHPTDTRPFVLPKIDPGGGK